MVDENRSDRQDVPADEPLTGEIVENKPETAAEAPAGDAPAAAAPKAPVRRRRMSGYTRRANLKVGQILGRSFSMYFANFFLFSAIAFLIFSPLLILSVVLEEEIQEGLRRLLQALLQQVATAAIIYGVFRRIKKDSAGMGRCLSVGLSRLFPLLGVLIVTGLAIVGVLIIPFIFIVILTMAKLIPLVVVVGLLSYVLVLWVVTVLYAASPCVVVERVGVMEAIRRSQILTRGNRWRIFAILFVLGLLQGLIGYIIATALDSAGAGYVTRVLFDYAHIGLWAALFAVTASNVYYRLKVEVEGLDEMELASVFD